MESEQVFTGFAEFDGTKIYYEVAGQGHPFVLIHAGLVDSRMWDFQFKKFAERYKVIRFDARGFGKSEIPDKPYSPVKDVYDLMNFLKIEKAHIMGCSMGGSKALDFALDYPQRVDRLVLVGPGVRGFTYSEALEQKGAELFKAAREKGTREAVGLFLEDPFWSYGVPSGDFAAARELFKKIVNDNRHIFDWYPNYIEMRGAPALERASTIKIPTTIIIGERDNADNLAAAEALRKKINNAVRIVIPGAGHMVNMEKPEEFNKIVLERVLIKEGKTMKELTNFRYRGARAAVLLHEREMRQLVETWKTAKVFGVKLPETKDPNYVSMEALLSHIMRSARGYMVWICEKLELPDPRIRPEPDVEVIEAEVDDYLEHLLEQWRKPLVEVRGRRFYQEVYTAPWNVDYCIDAMMEHAVVHAMRHRFQLQELMD